jgi:hypothetical protein
MTASIENGLEEPAIIDSIVKETTDRTIAECRVPLVAIPGSRTGVPPRARRTPWTGSAFDLASGHAASINRHSDRTAAVDRHANGDRRTEAAEEQNLLGASRAKGALGAVTTT